MSVVAAELCIPLASALPRHGIVDVADLCSILSCTDDAHAVALELLGDLYSPEFDAAMITLWDASKPAGHFAIGKVSEPLPSNVPLLQNSASSSNLCPKTCVSSAASTLLLKNKNCLSVRSSFAFESCFQTCYFFGWPSFKNRVGCRLGKSFSKMSGFSSVISVLHRHAL